MLNAKMPQAALERRVIPAVAIVNQKTWRPSIPSAAFDQLLGGPLRGIWRHRYVQNFSVDVPDHEKDVQSLEQDCSNAKEVTGRMAKILNRIFVCLRLWSAVSSAIFHSLHKNRLIALERSCHAGYEFARWFIATSKCAHRRRGGGAGR